MGRPKEARFDHEAIQRVIEGDRWRVIVSQLRLSRRERQIVESMLLGMDTEVRIADRLGMSPRTVQTHVQRLREKLAATSREQILSTVVLMCLSKDLRSPCDIASGSRAGAS